MRDAYARFTGTATIPVWSGNTAGKVRLNRGGNRQINCALHMIAVIQARGIGPGKEYLDQAARPPARPRTEGLEARRAAASPAPSNRCPPHRRAARRRPPRPGAVAGGLT